MPQDLTLEDRETPWPPRRPPKVSYAFWLVVVLFIYGLIDIGINQLREELFPFCPEYGGVRFQFREGTDPATAQAIVFPRRGERNLIGSYGAGADKSDAATASYYPREPVTREEFERYVEGVLRHSEVVGPRYPCPPAFSDHGVVIKRPRPVGDLALDVWWVAPVGVISLYAVFRKLSARTRSDASSSESHLG